ncbi:MAG TPA: RteC domain-containing protein [Chitinophagaceae bacterium]
MQFQLVCEELYDQMMSEINRSRRTDLSPASRIAYGFKITVEYWNRLREMIRVQPFCNESEEVWFFKILKPKVTAMMEYHTLVYHAELFMPLVKDDDLCSFWEKEIGKVKKFYRRNASFIHYYKSGRTNLDHLYFKQVSVKNQPAPNLNKLYDAGDEMICSHGHLATSLLAFEMYQVYIMEQVKRVA